MNPLTLLIKPAFEFASNWINKRVEAKQQERVLQSKIAEKKLDYVTQGRIAEVEWNSNAQKHNGWRGNYLTIVLSLPMILVFFPRLAPHIEAGFEQMKAMPDWYKAGVAVMIASAFGYRKYADWQMQKHYTLPSELETIRKLDEQ